MRFVVFSDLHLHNYSKFDKNGSRLKNCLSILLDVFKYANDNQIKIVVFCGDLFDQQKQIPTSVINMTVQVFKALFDKYPEISFISISGNHDHATKNLSNNIAETSQTFLSELFPNYHLIDNSILELGEVSFYGVPYYSKVEDFYDALQALVQVDNGSRFRYLLIHQSPQGLSNIFIPTDVDPQNDLFKNFEVVFSGHIHQFQILSDNMLMVGSPLHRDLGDEGDKKGFIVFDTDNSKFERILTNYPEFKRVSNEEDEDEESYSVIKIDEKELESIDTTRYNKSLSRQELVTNFWEDVDGKDEKLLKIGLSVL